MKQKKKERRIFLKKVIFVIEIIVISFSFNISYATETDVINSQKESLNISDFIKQSQDYTKDTFQDVDFNEVLESAMTGKLDNGNIYQQIIPLLGSELKDTLKTFRSNISNYCDS